MDALETAWVSFLTLSLCDGVDVAAQIGGDNTGRVSNTSKSAAQEEQ